MYSYVDNGFRADRDEEGNVSIYFTNEKFYLHPMVFSIHPITHPIFIPHLSNGVYRENHGVQIEFLFTNSDCFFPGYYVLTLREHWRQYIDRRMIGMLQGRSSKPSVIFMVSVGYLESAIQRIHQFVAV